MAEGERGVGKCKNDHPGSYGYPTRPEEPYDFCAECGNPMVWHCAKCKEPMPDDSSELLAARFCRHCGTPYFGRSRRAQTGKESGGKPSAR